MLLVEWRGGRAYTYGTLPNVTSAKRYRRVCANDQRPTTAPLGVLESLTLIFIVLFSSPFPPQRDFSAPPMLSWNRIGGSCLILFALLFSLCSFRWAIGTFDISGETRTTLCRGWRSPEYFDILAHHRNGCMYMLQLGEAGCFYRGRKIYSDTCIIYSASTGVFSKRCVFGRTVVHHAVIRDSVFQFFPPFFPEARRAGSQPSPRFHIAIAKARYAVESPPQKKIKSSRTWFPF